MNLKLFDELYSQYIRPKERGHVTLPAASIFFGVMGALIIAWFPTVRQGMLWLGLGSALLTLVTFAFSKALERRSETPENLKGMVRQINGHSFRFLTWFAGHNLLWIAFGNLTVVLLSYIFNIQWWVLLCVAGILAYTFYALCGLILLPPLLRTNPALCWLGDAPGNISNLFERISATVVLRERWAANMRNRDDLATIRSRIVGLRQDNRAANSSNPSYRPISGLNRKFSFWQEFRNRLYAFAGLFVAAFCLYFLLLMMGVGLPNYAGERPSWTIADIGELLSTNPDTELIIVTEDLTETELDNNEDNDLNNELTVDDDKDGNGNGGQNPQSEEGDVQEPGQDEDGGSDPEQANGAQSGDADGNGNDTGDTGESDNGEQGTANGVEDGDANGGGNGEGEIDEASSGQTDGEPEGSNNQPMDDNSSSGGDAGEDDNGSGEPDEGNEGEAEPGDQDDSPSDSQPSTESDDNGEEETNGTGDNGQSNGDGEQEEEQNGEEGPGNGQNPGDGDDPAAEGTGSGNDENEQGSEANGEDGREITEEQEQAGLGNDPSTQDALDQPDSDPELGQPEDASSPIRPADQMFALEIPALQPVLGSGTVDEDRPESELSAPTTPFTEVEQSDDLNSLTQPVQQIPGWMYAIFRKLLIHWR